MVNMLKGQTVTLYETTNAGYDDFGSPIVTTTAVNVDNVIVEPVSNDAILTEIQISGKKAVYTLHIPKGDNHDWKDKRVDIQSVGSFKTFGDCLVYDANLTPLSWNKKVKVEKYE